jgi:hypothetical protein
VRRKMTTLAAIIALLGLSACSAAAPMAPIGLDKKPANSPATIRALTAANPPPAANTQAPGGKDASHER